MLSCLPPVVTAQYIIFLHWLSTPMHPPPGNPTSIPQLNEFQSKLTLMSESLRNDGRIWVPKNKGDNRPGNDIPEEDRDYYLERRYPVSYTHLTLPTILRV